MQAKLPDINAILVTYRNAYLYSRRLEDYNNAVAMILEMNAALPDDYRIEINTEKYNNLTSAKKSAECRYCKTEHHVNTIKVKEVFNDFIVRSLTGIDLKKVWDCPSCGKQNLLKKTDFITDKVMNPTYFKVIDEPPKRNGWSDMDTFPNQIKDWLSRFMQEISFQCGKYRNDYVRQEEENNFGMIKDVQ